MAGAGYKLFNTGDVLTAAQVNTYLQEQTVMVFANSTARTTALSGVLAEGMMSYLQDTNSVEVYNGTSWVNVGNAGDLTEIVAGTGITVTSGTGPIPTVALTTPVAATNGGTAQTTYTTGDLLYASGTNTLAKRAIGSTGNVLTVSGGVPTWAAPATSGKVLQVVSATTSATFSSSSTSYVDITGLSVSITPASTSSKIMIFYVVSGQGRDTGVTFATQLVRGSTAISLGDAAAGKTQSSSATSRAPNANDASSLVVNFLDSPSTTSATTYKVQGIGTGATWYVNTAENDGFRFTSSITAFEIGA